MEAFTQSYAKKNVFFFHTMGGDQDVPNLHFKKHYRLDYPLISDNMDRVRHIIRVTGISNVAIFDVDGVCILNQGQMGENLKTFRKVIDTALKKARKSSLKKKAYIENGTVYAPGVKKEGRIIHERMAKMAAGPEGEVCLVYVSDESGSNDVFLRTFSGGKWSKDLLVAGTKSDEYAPAVAALGPGEVVIAYTGETKGRYEIFVVRVKDGKIGKPQQVSKSKDDAMAPDLSRGDRGDLWLVWYEWAKMGDLSRDREILLSHSKGGTWSKPVKVSPKNVPTYEDHADPKVCADGKGGAWVVWAWDYHGTLKDGPPVEENSIFLRHVDRRMKPGDVLAPGFRGEDRARDYLPTLAVMADGTPWVAWDNSHKASLGYSAKALFVNHLGGDDFEEQAEAAANKGPLDSPGLLLDPKGALHLVWGQGTRDGWELMRRRIAPGDPGKAKKIKVKGKSPRYPSACFDGRGKLFVAYTDMDGKKWKVCVERVD